MGEEFADTAPFLYFTSHGDPGLARMVSEGRWKEFEEFTIAGDFVDPQSAEAFERSKITWRLLNEPPHSDIFRLYREHVQLRRRWPCLHNGRKDLTRVEFDDAARWLRMDRSDPSGCRALLFCNFSDADLSSAGALELALSTAPLARKPGIVPACSASLYLAYP